MVRDDDVSRQVAPEEVQQHMRIFMRRAPDLEQQRADLERERSELEQRCHALQLGLLAAQEHEAEAKVRGRRAERRYQQLLMDLAEVADEYRLSVEQATEALDASAADGQPAAVQTVERIRRLVQAPLERIEEMLSTLDISVQQAEPGSEIDVHRFEVAATIEDEVRIPGTVMRTDRPAYVGRDGTVFRKGAVIVTRRSRPTDPQTTAS